MLMFVFKRGVVDDAATVCIATSIYSASTIAYRLCRLFTL